MSITKEQQKLKHQISIKYNKNHGSTSNPFPAAFLSAAGNGKIHASAWIFLSLGSAFWLIGVKIGIYWDLMLEAKRT
ncbi:hypothetical protein ACGEDE_18730 [Serratia marcescens]|uniref:hypothetical protein n=1 Tax=Serratia marcescens TaxID=615 RepID=UPI002AB4AD4A|nr:hypothetical protein [Serratia marcescens]MDY7608143.1 hypothetical protein [Serratia marcescens]